MLQGKNDYCDGGIFYAIFIAPQVKYCITINQHKKIEKMTFKGFTDGKKLLDRKQFFDLMKGKQLVEIFKVSWKKLLMVVL